LGRAWQGLQLMMVKLSQSVAKIVQQRLHRGSRQRAQTIRAHFSGQREEGSRY
jgi:hypothetical protein